MEVWQRSLFYSNAFTQAGGCNRAVGVVRDLVTSQCASIRGTVVGNGKAAIRGHDIQVKIHKAFAADGSAGGSDAMGGVAGGTTEAGIDVTAVLIPAGILHNLVG